MGSSGAAGLDLFACHDALIPFEEQVTVGTGIAIEVPKGCYARIAPRSGLTIKHMLDIKAGVIDRDYRGELKVVMYNYSHENYQVKKGDKIAQLILEVVEELDVE